MRVNLKRACKRSKKAWIRLCENEARPQRVEAVRKRISREVWALAGRRAPSVCLRWMAEIDQVLNARDGRYVTLIEEGQDVDYLLIPLPEGIFVVR